MAPSNEIPMRLAPPPTLKKKLRDAREYRSRLCRYFIPIDKLQQLVEPASVRAELKALFPDLTDGQVCQYAHLICSKSKRLFTILLVGCPERHHNITIIDLLDEDVNDNNLPFSRAELVNTDPANPYHRPFTLSTNGHSQCQRRDHTGCGIRAFAWWDEMDIQELSLGQWIALAPVFKAIPGQIPHLDLDAAVVLPFVDEQDQEDVMKGGYSEVWRARIHPAHQQLLAARDGEEPFLAIKRLLPQNNEREVFERERQMLTLLTLRFKHKHLVRLLATYTTAGKHHFLFLYAKYNLRTYWREHNPKPKWDGRTCLWVLRQMRGLASGLNVIHNFETPRLLGSDVPSDGATQQRPSLKSKRLKVLDQEQRYGRHGDIKPENILWIDYGDDVDPKGDLQIADLGLGRFHRLETRSRVDPRTIGGSATYMPPEIDLQQNVSRAYDIWSLGCVFLEFITWLLDGAEGVEAFVGARSALAYDAVVDDDTFYSVLSGSTGENAELRSGVNTWVAHLRRNPRCSDMVHALLDLVLGGMLRVKPEDRIRSKPLEDELEKILNRAEKPDTFLLEGRPRVG
ncbi:kinase-like protein [Acephala macrosclerotiorum]|nr:kinase-like protein [Acephala macrosclerotiorum]